MVPALLRRLVRVRGRQARTGCLGTMARMGNGCPAIGLCIVPWRRAVGMDEAHDAGIGVLRAASEAERSRCPPQRLALVLERTACIISRGNEQHALLITCGMCIGSTAHHAHKRFMPRRIALQRAQVSRHWPNGSSSLKVCTSRRVYAGRKGIVIDFQLTLWLLR